MTSSISDGNEEVVDNANLARFENIDDIMDGNEDETEEVSHSDIMDGDGEDVDGMEDYDGYDDDYNDNDITHYLHSFEDHELNILASPTASEIEIVRFAGGVDKIDGWEFQDSESLECIRIPSSVETIGVYAFHRCRMLHRVELCEGLVEIGNAAFQACTQLQSIRIPSSVKKIGRCAFLLCARLEYIKLCEGLEELGDSAFGGCYSLQSITIPPRIKCITSEVFDGCDELTDVNLSEGLECIRDRAFARCQSLRSIKIPSTVNEIHPDAFEESSNLVKVKFCDEIEEFVSGTSLRDWWNNGTSKHSLKTYSFLALCNVPARVGLLATTKWQATIISMLMQIPTVGSKDFDEYFDSIDSMLTTYERVPDAIPLLELAVWTSKIFEKHDRDNDKLNAILKLQCRNDCGACVIIPNVLLFL